MSLQFQLIPLEEKEVEEEEDYKYIGDFKIYLK